MKVIRILQVKYLSSTEGWCLEWFDLERDAMTRGNELENVEGVSLVEVNYVRFPARKDELVKWLNVYVSRDNG